MPRYQCHKRVWALKIAAIAHADTDQNVGATLIVPAEKGYTAFTVDREWVEKHNPQVGGYYVVYDDGYKSFSPAKAFEEGYIKISE
jgi:hypothetical protein